MEVTRDVFMKETNRLQETATDRNMVQRSVWIDLAPFCAMRPGTADSNCQWCMMCQREKCYEGTQEQR